MKVNSNSNYDIAIINYVMIISKYSMPFCFTSEVILLRVSNFYIKQKKAWNNCFIIWHQHQTTSRKIKANQIQ